MAGGGGLDLGAARDLSAEAARESRRAGQLLTEWPVCQGHLYYIGILVISQVGSKHVPK